MGDPEDSSIVGFHREVSLQWIWLSVLKGQVCTGTRFPPQPLSLLSSAYVCAAESIQHLLPCQMRDDLDVDKIFVLSWL